MMVDAGARFVQRHHQVMLFDQAGQAIIGPPARALRVSANSSAPPVPAALSSSGISNRPAGLSVISAKALTARSSRLALASTAAARWFG